MAPNVAFSPSFGLIQAVKLSFDTPGVRTRSCTFRRVSGGVRIVVCRALDSVDTLDLQEVEIGGDVGDGGSVLDNSHGGSFRLLPLALALRPMPLALERCC